MAATPFGYYRGAAYPMAADLSTAPRTGLDVQLCGDSHLLNFGGFGTCQAIETRSLQEF
jgi:uncharacterized protein (DUF2252 family)